MQCEAVQKPLSAHPGSIFDHRAWGKTAALSEPPLPKKEHGEAVTSCLAVLQFQIKYQDCGQMFWKLETPISWRNLIITYISNGLISLKKSEKTIQHNNNPEHH